MDAEHSDHDSAPTRALDEVEIRVLGCLLEKERTTPDDYPLTANALMRAANQSTSRYPVVAYDARTVEDACASLKAAGLVRFVHMPSGRATTKYRHVVDEAWQIDRAEAAILALLMLRGPQTPGELKTRADRLHAFEDLASVAATLDRLAARSPAVVRDLGRGAGQKEDRWAQLLGGEPVLVDRQFGEGRVARPSAVDASDRIDRLEAQIDELRSWVIEIREALGLDVTPPE